ncbi:NAD(P)-dependent dehydrogenase, short-chain alcohol dehydrogenase family [Nocardioides sp. YR527]|uniref:3-oxoacyl-ACP reductase family protein n=1 Tax=Nocardioides sp. YR527 TaxID=1881028 RepID=UPI000881A622|nr:3-oxoacyl-ACP reductase family protein [Nocardioides sp. YR527]SDK52805.1 NAD(P)-dependent dehydrogenase, short-chain alcohol dehydrogenase family [Nocardioides sp. YR527]
MSLDGAPVLVTGAGRGLGLAISRRLAQAGARVWLADIREDWLETAGATLREEGHDVSTVPVDVTDHASVRAMVKETGPVHGLVNNAARADGVGGKPVHEIDPAEWDSLMAVNLRGPWLVSREVVPGMIEAGGGRVLNIGSDSALYGSANLAHYIASKGGLAALTRAMARDLGPYGITVNTLAAGLTTTEAAQQIPEHRHQLYRDNRALTRDQEPADVVGAAAFLLGPEAAYITGQQLVVDGGFVFH